MGSYWGLHGPILLCELRFNRLVWEAKEKEKQEKQGGGKRQSLERLAVAAWWRILVCQRSSQVRAHKKRHIRVPPPSALNPSVSPEPQTWVYGQTPDPLTLHAKTDQ